jgi:hypothetical protein
LLADIRLAGGAAVSVGRPIATSTDVAERIRVLGALVEAIPSFVWKDHPQPPGRVGERT